MFMYIYIYIYIYIQTHGSSSAVWLCFHPCGEALFSSVRRCRGAFLCASVFSSTWGNPVSDITSMSITVRIITVSIITVKLSTAITITIITIITTTVNRGWGYELCHLYPCPCPS